MSHGPFCFIFLSFSKVEDIYSTTDDIYAPIQEEAIDEDIYDDLVSVTKRGGIMPTQEAVSISGPWMCHFGHPFFVINLRAT